MRFFKRGQNQRGGFATALAAAILCVTGAVGAQTGIADSTVGHEASTVHGGVKASSQHPLPPPTPATHSEISGARVIDAADIRAALALPCPPESLEARLRRVVRLYADRGHLDATLAPTLDSTGTLHLAIDEGRPARIAAVHLRGTNLIPETLAREILDLAPGATFRPPALEARIAALVDAYARRGYLDAEATLERVEIGAEGVVLGLAVSEGERSILDEVSIQGNTTTRSDLIRRLAGLETPRPADAGRIQEAPQLLRRSGLFADVGEPVLYRLQGSDRIGVVLPVVEAERRHSVFGVLGMARDPARSRPYLTGAIDLAFRNIYGTGRDLALDWRRDAHTGSRLAIGYHERFVLGTPFDWSLDLSQTVRDSTSTWQTAGMGFALPVRRNVTLDVGGAFDRSVYHLGVQGNTLRWRTGVGVRIGTLARAEDGVRYGTFEVRGEYAQRRNDLATGSAIDRARVDQTLVGGRLEAGVVMARRHGIGIRGELHSVETDALPVPESELYELGGTRSVRGYREGQFRGDRIAFGGVEYRYGHPRAAVGYAFCDVGAYARRAPGGLQTDGTIVGYGVGLRAGVATGLLDLAFAMGEERSFSGIKLHVSLLQRF